MQPEMEPTAPPEEKPAQPAVAVRDLVYTIRKQTILNGVSFAVYPGECFGVFGTRSTGKSSLLHVLAGVARFDAGTVRVLGHDIAATDRHKRVIGLVTQERSLFPDLNTGENLDYMAVLKNSPREKLLELVDRLELGAYLGEPITRVEAGVYQRLAVACALLNDPVVLLVDELINDVDLYSRRVIMRELERFLAAGGCCLWGFSNSEYFPQMDRVGWLEDGVIGIYDAARAAARWRDQVRTLYLPHGENDA